ncbi:MAG TPA: hypothetical protein VG938_01630 [Verrucomicrobiae bacterium]|jgi:hypothetical protein|nr:hypothetical protein [Verrucomicrobiae bacterium]
MNNDQAKEILKLYRPGTADAADPAFIEALELCERDEDLKTWFANHCALYSALRSKFRQISVPEGLKEQIIAERPIHRTPVWQRAVLAAGAFAIVALVAFNIQQHWRPREPHDFAAYRSYMDSQAVRGYYMDLTTNNLDQIRMFLGQKSAIADYVLPVDLEKNARAAGCVATTWQGKPVSMICFQSGRPLAPNRQSDLWLFITDRSAASDTPATSTPTLAKADGLITASWTAGGRTYVLAAEGDAQFLSKFLPASAVL